MPTFIYTEEVAITRRGLCGLLVGSRHEAQYLPEQRELLGLSFVQLPGVLLSEVQVW
jgi:hypothetical protein